MKVFLHPSWLIIITCSVCQGQVFLSPVIDFTQQVTIKRATARAFLNLSVGLEHNKNIFLAGPVIRIAQFDQVNPRPAFLSGVQYTHRYSFTDEGKKLRFFGEVMSKYQKVEEEWMSNYWNVVSNRYIDYEVESEEMIWENSLGAGVTWSFHKNFRLNSSIGLGYYISSRRPDDLDEQPLLSNRDYRGYRNNGIFYNIQIGITLLEELKPKKYAKE